MVLFVVFATALVTSVVAGGSCPEGWTYYGPQNQCLKKFDSLLSFESARATCQNVGADLVMIKDLAHNDFVHSLVAEGKDYWIGVFDDNKDHTFTYVDGSPLTYTYWYPGQPSNSGGKEFCTEVLAYAAGGKKWNDAPCYFKLKFVCAADAIPPVHCPQGWSHYEADDTCIKSFTSRQNYDNARKSCQSENGDLVQLQDDAHRSFVQGLTGSMTFWIGVWDNDIDKTFTYVDGSSLGSYAPWNRGEPNTPGGYRQCVMVYGTGARGKWNDDNCMNTLGYVCSTPAARCPKGYSYYEGDNSCIRVFSSRKPFGIARRVCQADNGDLAPIGSAADRDFILELSGNMNFWFGVYDDNRDRTFTFLDGSPLTFRPWNSGEPDNAGNREYCAMSIGDGRSRGKWNDGNCWAPLAFVCSTKG